jgi:NCS1 family nucleobase:cation symporter-1
MAPPGATTGQDDLLEAAGHPIGTGVIKSGYHPRLTNEDLAPLRRPAQV